MLNVDYDKSKFDIDEHGNLFPKVKKSKTSYNGFTLDIRIGIVRVWDKNDNFVDDFPDVQSAKEHINAL